MNGALGGERLASQSGLVEILVVRCVVLQKLRVKINFASLLERLVWKHNFPLLFMIFVVVI